MSSSESPASASVGAAAAAAAPDAGVPSTDPFAFVAPSDATHLAPGTWFVSAAPPRPLPPLEPLGPQDEVQLNYLCDVPQFVPDVARVLFAEWPDVYTDYFDMQSLPAVEEQLREDYMKKDKLGLVLVASVNGKFACTGTLTTDDVPAGHPYHGVKPWLTCLYCVPEFRKRGIATRVFETIASLARRWGYRHIWLITEDMQALYKKHGWREIETLPVWAPRVFTVMRRDLVPLDAPAPFVPKKVVKPKLNWTCTVSPADAKEAEKLREELTKEKQQQ